MICALEAEDISFSYGRHRVLHGATLAVLSGEITALIGPNGAGKTTLLRALAGLLVVQSGRVRPRGGHPPRVAYLAQGERLPSDFTVREVVELGRLPYVGWWRALGRVDHGVVRQAMERTRVESLADRLIGTLSGGEQQRVALARALAQQPRVLLLDEPTVHLDLRCQLELFAALRAEAAHGVGILVVMHDLTSASQADRCALLAEGTIRAVGRPSQVLAPALLREVFHADVERLRARDGRIVLVPMVHFTSNGSCKETAWMPVELS